MASTEEINLAVPVAKTTAQHEPLPEGKYTMVAIDIDTTGKRLIDEVKKNRAFPFSSKPRGLTVARTFYRLFILPSTARINRFPSTLCH